MLSYTNRTKPISINDHIHFSSLENEFWKFHVTGITKYKFEYFGVQRVKGTECFTSSI